MSSCISRGTTPTQTGRKCVAFDRRYTLSHPFRAVYAPFGWTAHHKIFHKVRWPSGDLCIWIPVGIIGTGRLTFIGGGIVSNRSRSAIAFVAGFLLAITALPPCAAAHQPVTLGPMLLGYDLDDLPENPSIDQQIEAGRKQLAVLREDNPTIDSNAEVLEYFNAIVKKLLAASPQPAPFPITVHVSSEPIMNAEAMPGGIILVYENLFDETQTESVLVSVLAHETAHQLHNDFLKFWSDYKNDREVYGKGGVLEQSQGIEAAADRTSAQLMYAAGWNPQGMVDFLKAMHSLGVRARRGEPAFYSTHPRDRERIARMEQFVAGLAPKPGLISDSPEFQALKQKY